MHVTAQTDSSQNSPETPTFFLLFPPVGLSVHFLSPFQIMKWSHTTVESAQSIFIKFKHFQIAWMHLHLHRIRVCLQLFRLSHPLSQRETQ